MRHLFLALVFIHGLIHLLGFIKAFDIANIDALASPISKGRGILWLLGALTFVVASGLHLFKIDLWWIFAIVAIALSQILIISAWADARYGTIPNLIILMITVVAGSEWYFNRNAQSKVETLLSQNAVDQVEFKTHSGDSLVLLNNWLGKVGAMSNSDNVYLKQSGKLRLKPEASWLNFEAEQWVTTSTPGFVWNAKVGQGSILSFSGRDSFLNGQGQMLIKMYGLIPIVNAENEAIDQGTAIRYLAELVWFPWAAKSRLIEWEVLSAERLKATFNYKELSVSGIFEFADNGLPSKFEAMRYNDQTGKEEKWVVNIKSYKDFDGLILPSVSEVTWHLQEGEFTWFKINVEQAVIINK